MQEEIRTYIDLDGVLVNFLKSACKYFNVPYPENEVTVKNTFLTDHYGIPKAEIDNLRDNYDWWINLEKYFWTDNLLKFCQNNSNKLFILTKPMDHGECYKAKYDWCLKNLNVQKNQIIITEVPKWYFASDNYILIDDKPQIIHNWKEYGGIGYNWTELIMPDSSVIDFKNTDELDKRFTDIAKIYRSFYKTSYEDIPWGL